MSKGLKRPRSDETTAETVKEGISDIRTLAPAESRAAVARELGDPIPWQWIRVQASPNLALPAKC
ncbi:MAG: hypothetical protein Fues2KO_23880 [Fuerstiella sp.]